MVGSCLYALATMCCVCPVGATLNINAQRALLLQPTHKSTVLLAAGEVRDRQPAARLVVRCDARGVACAAPQPGKQALLMVPSLAFVMNSCSDQICSKVACCCELAQQALVFVKAWSAVRKKWAAQHCALSSFLGPQKCLAALASGSWLLGPSWVDDCQAAGALVPEVGVAAQPTQTGTCQIACYVVRACTCAESSTKQYCITPAVHQCTLLIRTGRCCRHRRRATSCLGAARTWTAAWRGTGDGAPPALAVAPSR